jgi:hypothetical protein
MKKKIIKKKYNEFFEELFEKKFKKTINKETYNVDPKVREMKLLYDKSKLSLDDEPLKKKIPKTKYELSKFFLKIYIKINIFILNFKNKSYNIITLFLIFLFIFFRLLNAFFKWIY